MNRLYVVESSYSITGSNADHRLRIPAREIERYLVALARELNATHHLDLGPISQALQGISSEGFPEPWIRVVADELKIHAGRSLIVAGSAQPARVHALVHALNGALGNVGQTVRFSPPVDASEMDNATDLRALTDDIEAGKVDALVILGGNPVYDAPFDSKFAERLHKVKTTVDVSSRLDETAKLCTWHVPRAHEFECWGDQRSLDGTWSIQQPLISPLFGARSDIEILSMIAGDAKTGYDLVRATFRAASPVASLFERTWKLALQKGWAPSGSSPTTAVTGVHSEAIASAFRKGDLSARKPLTPNNLEVVFLSDRKLFDGRYANNPWLLELPDAITKIVWDNAAYISPKTAADLSVASGDMIEIAREGAKAIQIAVWISPGQADNSIGLPLGWGRTHAGRYGNGHGFDVNPLRTTDAMSFADGVSVRSLGRKYTFSQTQEHQSMEGRPVAIDATLDQYRETPDFAQFRSPNVRTLPLWKKVEYTGHKWGMSIDLSACTGCNACVIACQSENNIAFVGKDEVGRGREMHWIRVDRYFVGEEHDPEVAFQPLACVQCEEAPCENVCPVNATEHSPEGLNDMAYNRCIGTRYCANNCPYKVRRFNYKNWRGDLYGDIPETEKMQFNPNVTVRMRGVMEKCTYCVQRIQTAKITSKRTGKPLKDGDITPACAQTCPADAIVFGDLNEPSSRVTELAKRDRTYALLADLGTHPRTTYLGKIRNPNREMAG